MNKCESDNNGICMSMLCLSDRDCGSRKKDGAPNYGYLYSNPARREKCKETRKKR